MGPYPYMPSSPEYSPESAETHTHSHTRTVSHTHTHTHTQTHSHVHLHTHTHIQLHTHTHIILLHTITHTHACMRAFSLCVSLLKTFFAPLNLHILRVGMLTPSPSSDFTTLTHGQPSSHQQYAFSPQGRQNLWLNTTPLPAWFTTEEVRGNG